MPAILLPKTETLVNRRWHSPKIILPYRRDGRNWYKNVYWTMSVSWLAINWQKPKTICRAFSMNVVWTVKVSP